jgi:hypothetical protein
MQNLKAVAMGAVAALAFFWSSVPSPAIWLDWAYLTKTVPHAATTPIVTAFKICISHKKNGPLNRLPAGES